MRVFFILSIYHQVAELKSPLGGANELSGQAKEVQVVWQEVGFTSFVVRYSFINRIVYSVEVVDLDIDAVFKKRWNCVEEYSYVNYYS